MQAIFKQCPKCGHQRTSDETATPDKCPACGIYFAKWEARETFVPPAQLVQMADEQDDDATPRWRDHLIDRILYVPKEISDVQIWGRAATLVFLLVWGIRMAAMDYRNGEIATSFMHNILLPIHEAGHILFIPFGEFMTILGGSLFPILFPLIIADAVETRDTCLPCGVQTGEIYRADHITAPRKSRKVSVCNRDTVIRPVQAHPSIPSPASCCATGKCFEPTGHGAV